MRRFKAVVPCIVIGVFTCCCSLLGCKGITSRLLGSPVVAGSDERQFAMYYAPGHDLEDEDVAVLQSAKRSVDMAMYSLTDDRLCGALVEAAGRGVKVRVYRDREQYAEEVSRARGRGREACTDKLLASGVEVRVKASSVLMHLKSYCVDGVWLRSGSANGSFGGEREQDNDVFFIASDALAGRFEQEFTALWSRPDNVVVRLKGL